MTGRFLRMRYKIAPYSRLVHVSPKRKLTHHVNQQRHRNKMFIRESDDHQVFLLEQDAAGNVHYSEEQEGKPVHKVPSFKFFSEHREATPKELEAFREKQAKAEDKAGKGDGGASAKEAADAAKEATAAAKEATKAAETATKAAEAVKADTATAKEAAKTAEAAAKTAEKAAPTK